MTPKDLLGPLGFLWGSFGGSFGGSFEGSFGVIWGPLGVFSRTLQDGELLYVSLKLMAERSILFFIHYLIIPNISQPSIVHCKKVFV